eukprot:934023-Rhodomonas_salina.1
MHKETLPNWKNDVTPAATHRLGEWRAPGPLTLEPRPSTPDRNYLESVYRESYKFELELGMTAVKR